MLSVKFAFVFFNFFENKGNKKSVKPTLPPAIISNLSLIIGVVTVSLLDTNPMPPSNFNLSVYGFFTLISRTDAILPPYLEGIFAWYMSTPEITSGVKTENKPKRWVGLNTGA